VLTDNAMLRVEALRAGVAIKEAEHLRVQLRTRDGDVKVCWVFVFFLSVCCG
jgi:hypothetical protein